MSRLFAAITDSEAETDNLRAANALPPIIPKIDESEPIDESKPTTPDNGNFKSALNAWKKRQSVIVLSPMSPN